MALISVADALKNILSDAERLPSQSVPLLSCEGRTLADDLKATRDQPPFAASAMDGYAVRAQDAQQAGAALTVIGEAPAGRRYQGAIGPGEAVRIFTGAPTPEGADAILIQENAERDGEKVKVLEPVSAGRYIRPIGLDFKAGDVQLRAGVRLGFRELSLAAALNHPAPLVTRQPKVAILATGDELVEPGALPGPDQIIASNQIGLAAFVTECGGEPINLGVCPDDPHFMKKKIEQARAAQADILITLGGASVGDHDIVQDVLKHAGMELAFWRIAMRPGKPLMAGRLDGMKVLALPGNPVSGLICAILFLKPLIYALLGRSGVAHNFDHATLLAPLPQNDEREEYVRATLQRDKHGQLQVKPFTRQDSSMLSSLAHSQALILRPPHASAAGAGEKATILRLDTR